MTTTARNAFIIISAAFIVAILTVALLSYLAVDPAPTIIDWCKNCT